LTAVLLALGASLFWGFADFGAGAATRRLPVFVVAAVSQTAGLVAAALVVLATAEGTPSARQFAWAAFAGLVGLLGLSFFYRALAMGTMGIVGPITATAAIVPVAYGLGRGERPSTLQGSGVGLAVIDASVRYHLAARYDNLIRVRTVLTSVRSRTVSFDYTIEDAATGARLASATTTLASLNGEGKLVALPDEIRRVMEDARQ